MPNIIVYCECGEQLTSRNRPGNDGVIRCIPCATKRRQKKYNDSSKGKRVRNKNVRKYQLTEKGREAKHRADKNYRQTHREESAAYKNARYHALSDEEKTIRNRRNSWRSKYGIDPLPVSDKCEWCGSNSRLELDHKHPTSKGGLTNESNIWTLCRSCNAFKSDRLVTEGNYPGVLMQ